ncbi:peptide chain release factor N(5)-glutamine methyltransferase [Candidatus Falkowbacteria bacterium]|uniref:peptide chain release factor N(5)-glutamine methyltransferase n=1 Tax=Candidatus Buchananbacteria bacterium CG10_big_fil_rev_8_21_14_0_10_33_19 TaxID=1974525 RepID=A0A2H0W5K6_9BACT|nr:peptide chain release factor N(5)-glutamine methyltransferase [Candidatus Falkowbacteria bacterium]PIS05920.1 MAG: peptide chain release factor N(5)-glutamine methyltransferase [Candidatus Buchananbacteria bacterium CG10_big_fil_rev_8_21_14_0_10_33_19]
MTLIEITRKGANKLKQAKIPSAVLDAEVLMMYVLNKSKEYIITNPDKKITKGQAKKYQSSITRRQKFEPLAYLVGQKEFYGLDFIVNKNVLIPRPETELLIDEFIKTIGNKNITVADIGTGSGAIAITLKKNLPQLNVMATDISLSAIKLSQTNARLNKVNIKFIKNDLIKNITDKIDIIITNLPYVPTGEKKLKNIYTAPLKYEPAQALYGGKYGLDVYEKLFIQINNLNYKPQWLFCEIGSTYVKKTLALTKSYFPQAKITIKKDLCGKDRLLVIKNV